MTAEFDFIQSYRDLDGGASRDVVEARQRSFQKLSAAIDKTDQTYDLCRLAYQIEPFTARPWFEDTVREFDPHFVASKDKVDAGRIAALLLRQRMTSSGSHLPLAILTTSYCGRRHSADGDVLTKQANDAFLAAVRNHRVSDGAKLGPAPKLKAITTEVDAMAAIDAAMASTDAAVKSLWGPVDSARGDIARLAEEVDMLWWCIGDWHELLDKPRTETAAVLTMVVSGIELGAMVRQLPGPFGAHGIFEKGLRGGRRRQVQSGGRDQIAVPGRCAQAFYGHSADIEALVPRPRGDPVRRAVWAGRLGSGIREGRADIAAAKMSPFELVIQAFRERALLANGGIA